MKVVIRVIHILAKKYILYIYYLIYGEFFLGNWISWCLLVSSQVQWKCEDLCLLSCNFRKTKTLCCWNNMQIISNNWCSDTTNCYETDNNILLIYQMVYSSVKCYTCSSQLRNWDITDSHFSYKSTNTIKAHSMNEKMTRNISCFFGWCC